MERGFGLAIALDRRNADAQRNHQRSQQHQHGRRDEYACTATEVEHGAARSGAGGNG